MKAIVVEVIGKSQMVIGAGWVRAGGSGGMVGSAEAVARYSQQALGELAREARRQGLGFFAYSKGKDRGKMAIDAMRKVG